MKSSYTVAGLLAKQVALGQVVKVQGWVKTRRDSKGGFSFINLHDGSCFAPIQIVAPNALTNYETEVKQLTSGCSLSVEGVLVENPQASIGIEIQATQITIHGWVEDPDTYPISPKKHTLEYLREVAHLRPRTNTLGAMSRVRHTVAQAIHRFFSEQGFFWVTTPIITTSDCEGAGELFRVSTLDLMNLPKKTDGQIDFNQDFFGREAFLTVSGQLNLEAYCLALSKVYTFGPTFRSEQSNTSRHLAEFWMIEPEVAFADLGMNADLAEALLKFVFKAVLSERADDMAFFAQQVEPEAVTRLVSMVDQSFERMDYSEAIRHLQASKENFIYPVSWGVDLQSEHERYLAEKLVKRPVILMNYPKDIKAFYMRLNEDGKTVAAMDVLAPGIGEIIGGSQREERLDLLDQRMISSGLNPETYYWYRDLRRYGSVPHAGFGLGFERLISYITGLPNVRDVIPFPRTPGSADF